jgi:hypothetical protein
VLIFSFIFFVDRAWISNPTELVSWILKQYTERYEFSKFKLNLNYSRNLKGFKINPSANGPKAAPRPCPRGEAGLVKQCAWPSLAWPMRHLASPRGSCSHPRPSLRRTVRVNSSHHGTVGGERRLAGRHAWVVGGTFRALSAPARQVGLAQLAPKGESGGGRRLTGGDEVVRWWWSMVRDGVTPTFCK